MNKDTQKSELPTPEEQKLLLEIEAKKKENRWYIPKIIAWLLSAIAIPLSALIITINESHKQETMYKHETMLKNKDFEVQLMSFFLENYEQFFSTDTLVVNNIAKVIAVLDTNYNKNFLINILNVSSEQNKKLFNKASKLTRESVPSHPDNAIWFVIRNKGNNLPVQNANFSVLINEQEYKATTDKFGLAKIDIPPKYDSELEYEITVQNKTFHRHIRKVVCIEIPNN